MTEAPKEKNLELERLVFFSDAVVAIAITLLVLDLNVKKQAEHLTFTDLLNSWQNFLAFLLSFIMIVLFWKIHHEFFYYIKKISQRLLLYNLGWLLFITILPFATKLVSADIFNKTAVFVYCTVIFAITIFQNALWDHASFTKDEFMKDTLADNTDREYRVACNIAIFNAVLAMIVCFISPLLAFLILFTRTLMFRTMAIRYIMKETLKTTGRRFPGDKKRAAPEE